MELVSVFGIADMNFELCDKVGKGQPVKIITDNSGKTIVFGNTDIHRPCNHTVPHRSVAGFSSVCMLYMCVCVCVPIHPLVHLYLCLYNHRCYLIYTNTYTCIRLSIHICLYLSICSIYVCFSFHSLLRIGGETSFEILFSLRP